MHFPNLLDSSRNRLFLLTYQQEDYIFRGGDLLMWVNGIAYLCLEGDDDLARQRVGNLLLYLVVGG
jgi:hypothetical protein